MAHYIDNKKIVFNSSIVIQDGKQSDDYILVSDANGLAYWDTRTNYISTKEFDHYVGEWFGGGVVVAVWKESNGLEKCLVAAPQDCSYLGTERFSDSGPSGPFDNLPFLGFTVPWSNVATTANGASWSVSGASNSNIIVSQAGFSTTINPFVNGETSTLSGFSGAAQYALNYINPDLGTGVFNDWYLPAAHEILALWNNASVVNKVLAEYSAYNSISTDIPSFPPLSLINPMINFFESRGDDDNYSYDQGYWTSTQASPTEAYYLSQDGSLKRSPKNPSQGSYYINYKRVRPFRIASDSQVSFNFDAEYIIISYKFLDGNDLDTRTRMIYPNSTSHPALITPWNENVGYNSGVNGGPKSVNFMGHTSMIPWATSQGDGAALSYTPNVTETTPAPNGFYNPGTYSIMRWGGDVTGPGGLPSSYETMLVNVNAFKFHFPGVDTIRIDCRGWWFGGLGSTVVRLGVNMYRGGTPILTGYPGFDLEQWDVPDATSNLLLDSLDVAAQSIYRTGTGGVNDQTPEGLQKSTRIAIVEYNINTKIGKIIK
jgi:hypothetical protein